MLIAGFPAGAFAANCYVVAPAAGEECLIIDPGQDAEAGIEEILATHRLKPAAVLLTHGHLDHVWSVAPVCGAKDIPAYIHPADRELLSDPAKGLPLGAGQQLFGGLEFTEPDDVQELSDGITLDLVGLSIVVDHAPGHTRGSVAFRLPGERQAQPGPEPRQSEAPAQPGPEAQAQPGPEAQAQPGPGAPAPARGPGGRLPPDRGVTGGSPPGGNTVPGGNTEILFSGDLLFAGSIGRTDLPGGDYPTIMRSLARVCLNLPDETIVLSGHGPQTTIGAERRGNPFLNGMQPIARGL